MHHTSCKWWNTEFKWRLGGRSNVTSLQDFLDFDVVRTEAAVVLEVVGVIKKRSSQREEEFLRAKRETRPIKSTETTKNRETRSGKWWVFTLNCPGVSRWLKLGQEAILSSSVWRKTLWKSNISGRLPNNASIWGRDAAVRDGDNELMSQRVQGVSVLTSSLLRKVSVCSGVRYTSNRQTRSWQTHGQVSLSTDTKSFTDAKKCSKTTKQQNKQGEIWI